MKRNIYLEGEIGLKFGRKHSFHGESVRDALRLIEANNPDFKKYLIACQEVDLGFHIQVGTNEVETPLECLLPLREGDIIITPVAAGSKSGGAKILTAVAIAALLFVPGGAAFVGLHGIMSSASVFGALQGAGGLYAIAGLTAASLAVNLAITGIQQLMAPDPSVDKEDEGYLFNGSQQNIVEGMPIPLLYGELRVPGHQVSVEAIGQNSRVTSTQTFVTNEGQVVNANIESFEDPNSAANLGELTAGDSGGPETTNIPLTKQGFYGESSKIPSSSQEILFTDIISEGPIYGLVDGGHSVYLNEDPAQTAKQSFIRASETPVEFDFINGETSVTIDKNGYDKSIQIDSSGTKYITVKSYLSRSSTVAITNSSNTKVVSITAASAIFSATDVYDPSSFTSATIIRLLDSDSITVFEGYIQTRTSDTVAICIPLPGASLNTSLASGSYTVVKDVKLQITSIAADESSLTLSTAFAGTTGTYKADLTGTDYGKVSLQDSITDGSKYDSFSLQFRTGTLFQPAFSDDGSTGIGNTAIPQGASFSGTIDSTSGDTSAAIVEYQGQSAGGFGLTAAQAEQVDEIRVAFAYPQIWNRNEKGEQVEGTVRYTASIAIKKDSASSFGSYQEIDQNWTHIGQSNAPRIFEEIVNLRQYQPFYDFKLKIERITNSDEAYNRGTNTPNPNYTTATAGSINSLSSVIKENLSYPLTSMAKVRVNARQFSSPPSRTYHCRGLKVKVPSNYVTREEGENGVATYNRNVSTGAIESSYQDWDGNFRADKIYTNNPAWVFYDILTNNRYGLGEWLLESEIDKYALYRIARYCDELVDNGAGGTEPRFTTNVYLTQATDAYKVIKDLASIFRSMIYWLDGEIYTVADQPGDPVYNFSKANVIDGAFSYETTGSKTRANQIVVTWNNPKANYKLENLIVEDRQNIIKTGRIISEEAVAFGATSEGQALRYGRWKLWTAVNQTEIVSFKTAINAAFLAPGDIINIQDADRHPGDLKYSGRVSNTGTPTTTSIPLDRTITLNSGSTYELSVAFTDSVATLAQDSATISSVSYSRGDIIQGASIDTSIESSNIIDDSGNYVDVTWKPYTNVETKTVSTSAGSVSSLTVSSAFSAAPSAESLWMLRETIGGVEVFGSKKEYKILSIGESARNEYAITAVEFYNEKYTAVDEEFTLSTQDPLFAPPVSGTVIPAPRNVYIYVSDLDSGSVENDAIFYWDSPTTDGTDLSPEYQFVDYYELVTNVPRTPSTVRVEKNVRSIRGNNLDPGTFTVGVRTVALNGQKSELQKVTFTIQDPAKQAVPRAYGMALGATGSSPAFITSAGVFTIENQEYVISPAGYPQLVKQFDGSPATEYTQDCSDIDPVTYSALDDDEAAFASHYIMFDASEADPFTLVKFYRDEDLGYSYFYDAGTGGTDHTSNWTSIGTVSVAANSNTVTGSGFASSVQVGDIVKFSSTQAAKVAYVSDTELKLDKSFTTAISSVTGYRNSFRFDKDKDAIFYQIRNDGGTFKAFPVNYVVNPDLAQTIRFVKMSAEPGVLLFNADDTKNWTENSTLTLTVVTTGFSNPEFKVTGAGFSFVDESADTAFSSSNIRTLTLDDTVTYTSTFPVFTVTVREKNDPSNTAKQKTDTISLSLLKDGVAGSAGNVGLSVYKATSTNSAPSVPSGDLTYTFATGALTEDVAGNLNGWTTAVPSISTSNPYIWVTKAVALGAVGETTDTIETGDWASPALYSEGPLNSAVVELFQVTSSSTAPADPTTSLTYTFSTAVLSGSGFNGWSQTATSTSAGEYLWKIAAYALSNGTTDTITTDDWADAKIVGYAGTDGSAGSAGKLVRLTSDDYSVVYDSLGANPSPSGTLTFTATATNFTDPYFKFTGDGITDETSYTDGTGNTDTFTYSIPSSTTGWAGNPLTIRVGVAEAADSTTEVAFDTISIFYVADGADGDEGIDGYTVILTNAAHSFTADNSGTVSSYSGSGTDIEVYKGGTELDSVTGTPGAGEFSVSVSASNITAGTTSVSANKFTIGDHSNMTADTAVITYTLNIENSVTGTQKQTFSKSSAGADGAAGDIGNAIVQLYQVTSSNSAPSDPTTALTYTFSTGVLSGSGFNGWSQTAPDTSASNPYLWMIAATALGASGSTDSIATSEWSTASLISKFGDDGTPANNLHLIELFQLTNSSTAPNTTGTGGVASSITYTFSSQAITGSLGNWSTSASSVTSSNQYLWKTSAVASSTGTSDTIANTEFATPVIVAHFGSDGTPGANGLRTAQGIVYKTETAGASAPSTPSGTWSFTNKNFSSLTAGWSVSPPTYAANGTYDYYYSIFNVEESSSGSGSGTADFDTPAEGINFTGLVTFTERATSAEGVNLSYEGSSYTTIFGGNIATGTITLNKLSSTNSENNPVSFSEGSHTFKLATGGVSIAGTSYDSTAQFISNHTGDCANVFCQYTGADADSFALVAVTDTGKAGGFSYGSGGSYGTSGTNYLEICNSGSLLVGYEGSSERFKVSNNGAITINNVFTLPTSDGTSGQVLQTNGSGTVTWATVSGGGSGSVTSVGLTAPTGFSVSGSPVTSSGTLALSFATGYSLPTTTSQSNWNTAYGWGNHASAGYLTSETSHADVVVDGDFSSTGLMKRGATAGSYSIVTDNSTNWDTAFSWGNHASAGYASLSGANFTGAITSTGDITAFYSSDRRMKDNITPIENSLEKVTQLGGYEFDWNHVSPYEGMHDIGVIAQEVLKVAPEAVAKRENDMLAVRYEKLVPLLIEAIKDLKEEIEELKRDSSN